MARANQDAPDIEATSLTPPGCGWEGGPPAPPAPCLSVLHYTGMTGIGRGGVMNYTGTQGFGMGEEGHEDLHRKTGVLGVRVFGVWGRTASNHDSGVKQNSFDSSQDADT